MTRHARALDLDDDRLVSLTLRVPPSLLRMLHSYCIFRGYNERKIGAAAIAAIRAYFAGDAAFRAWLRDHPEAPSGTSSGASSGASSAPPRPPRRTPSGTGTDAV